MAISDQEWNQRVLCSDGNCIGIIGSDGRCKECGQPYDGKLPIAEKDVADGGAREAVAVEQEDHDGVPVAEEEAIESDASGDDWNDRTLCIDGNCIGIVGTDGRCNVCGKAHPGK